jgi:large subunit ribosomal protein L3
MLKKFLAKKGKMTQVYLQDGRLFGVTILDAPPATILQLKNKVKDGYSSLQLGFGQAQKSNQALKGHLKKSKASIPQKIRELRIPSDESDFKLGDQITIDQVFDNHDLVKVTGFSKGRGFAGVIKRHGFHSQPATHGQSDRERTTGSIGPQTPGKVIKGKKMPGHFGNAKASTKNIKVLKVDPQAHQIYLAGSVPGAPNSWVEIEKTGKKTPSTFALAQPDQENKDSKDQSQNAQN